MHGTVSDTFRGPTSSFTHSWLVYTRRGFSRARSLHRRRGIHAHEHCRRRSAQSSEPRVGALAMDDCDIDPRKGRSRVAPLVCHGKRMGTPPQIFPPYVHIASPYVHVSLRRDDCLVTDPHPPSDIGARHPPVLRRSPVGRWGCFTGDASCLGQRGEGVDHGACSLRDADL